MWTELEDALFSLLCRYDRTWAIIRQSDTAVIIENAEGKQVHASTLEVALRTALEVECRKLQRSSS